jgi:hypothetical protein
MGFSRFSRGIMISERHGSRGRTASDPTTANRRVIAFLGGGGYRKAGSDSNDLLSHRNIGES